jgi:hypothetical protein
MLHHCLDRFVHADIAFLLRRRRALLVFNKLIAIFNRFVAWLGLVVWFVTAILYSVASEGLVSYTAGAVLLIIAAVIECLCAVPILYMIHFHTGRRVLAAVAVPVLAVAIGMILLGVFTIIHLNIGVPMSSWCIIGPLLPFFVSVIVGYGTICLHSLDVHLTDGRLTAGCFSGMVYQNILILGSVCVVVVGYAIALVLAALRLDGNLGAGPCLLCVSFSGVLTR